MCARETRHKYRRERTGKQVHLVVSKQAGLIEAVAGRKGQKPHDPGVAETETKRQDDKLKRIEPVALLPRARGKRPALGARPRIPNCTHVPTPHKIPAQ